MWYGHGDAVFWSGARWWLPRRERWRGSGSLHEASGADLAELMARWTGWRRAGQRVAVTVEAVRRGEVAESGMNVHAWVREHATSLRQGGAGHVARWRWRWPVLRGGGVAGRCGDAGCQTRGRRWAWCGRGARRGVSPALAVAALGEVARLEPLLAEAGGADGDVGAAGAGLGVGARGDAPAAAAAAGRARPGRVLDDLQDAARWRGCRRRWWSPGT